MLFLHMDFHECVIAFLKSLKWRWKSVTLHKKSRNSEWKILSPQVSEMMLQTMVERNQGKIFPFQDNEISFNQAKGVLDCSCIFRNVCKLSGSLTQNMNEYGLLKCKVCASKYTLCNHSKPIWVPLQLLSTGAASFFCSHAWSCFVCTAVGRGC